MPLRALKRWVTSLPYSLPVAWILLHFVTLRWQQGPDMPPGAGGELAPLWGFPLPWAWWPPVSSLHWDLSIVALLLNLTAYSAAVATVGEPIRSRLPTISKWLRRAGYLVLLGMSVWVGFFWFFGLAVGGHRIVLLLPTEHVTRVSICLAQGCYLTY